MLDGQHGEESKKQTQHRAGPIGRRENSHSTELGLNTGHTKCPTGRWWEEVEKSGEDTMTGRDVIIIITRLAQASGKHQTKPRSIADMERSICGKVVCKEGHQRARAAASLNSAWSRDEWCVGYCVCKGGRHGGDTDQS